jgi:phosphoglycolate phosphatase-like HAD superfamily hydrolase
MKIVLFDIDGTLLLSDGAGRAAMEAALVATFGTSGPSAYRYGGKTDRLIVRETMRLEGFDDATIDARMQEVLDLYLTGLRAHLEHGTHTARALPGVAPLLDAIESQGELVLGLLTGNIVEGAGVKLRAVALDPKRFRLGAYGSDHEERPMLPPIARERASALLGREVPGDRLIIVGDTPADITCGMGVGARAIAVATGGFPLDDLRVYEPMAAFADLSDTARVMEAILDA